jgi:hypothetical protein
VPGPLPPRSLIPSSTLLGDRPWAMLKPWYPNPLSSRRSSIILPSKGGSSGHFGFLRRTFGGGVALCPPWALVAME